MTIGIYRLIFNNTDKCYIGQSVDIERRYLAHINTLRKGCASYKLQKAYEQFGQPVLDILLDNLCINELDENEESAIELFNSVENGFNTLTGPTNTSGGTTHSRSKYTREQLIEVYVLLGTSKLLHKDIGAITGVSIGTVHNISKGDQHLWLQEEFPDIFEKVLLRRKPKFDKYPELLSPAGEVISITNASQFAVDNNLLQTSLSRLLRGKIKSHRGWTVSNSD